MRVFEIVKSVARKVTGVSEDKRFQKRTVVNRNNFELPGEVGECYWCHNERPLKMRLVGLNLCKECAPPIEKHEEKRITPWGGEDIDIYYRPSNENMNLWIERRKQMLLAGWRGQGVPPRVDEVADGAK
jgi:hypothetical protein